MLTFTKRGKLIEEFKKIKLPNNFGINSKEIKFKVSFEVLKEEFEDVIHEEFIVLFKSINYIVSSWDCIYNDDCFTVLTINLEPIHGEDMLYNLFFLKKLFDDINNMYGTEEYEERFSEVMKKVIANH
tara:strand:+ start:4263 stop:4646 length:384 start_codon:yes stop_codon:yes gene_type:complete